MFGLLFSSCPHFLFLLALNIFLIPPPHALGSYLRGEIWLWLCCNEDCFVLPEKSSGTQEVMCTTFLTAETAVLSVNCGTIKRAIKHKRDHSNCCTETHSTNDHNKRNRDLTLTTLKMEKVERVMTNASSFRLYNTMPAVCCVQKGQEHLKKLNSYRING